ncbi:MAG: hypothetical protein CME65_13270 [Halobacteriovoraceae bacterium]|nr:hypothetical protein [Halobacteriovoraceae bacterium]|tara:strand:+ start:5753 stop:6061 length:309 start_codon:yes stop_codon:yes gene_type:complete
MEEFIQQIIKNLANNGFPHKRVSLPTEKMFEIADGKGLSFNAVLDQLKEKHQITGEIGPDTIVFSLSQAGSDMFSKAQEMMSKMSPEEMQDLMQKAQDWLKK